MLLPDRLEQIARVSVKKAGTLIGSRRGINLIEGTNVSITASDDPTDEEVDVTLAVSSAAPSGSAGGALDGTYPNPGLASSVAGNGLAESSDVLSVNVDASTIEINSDTLRLKDGGTTNAKLASMTRGTLKYGNSSAAAADLTIGSSNTVLRSDGTDPSWGKVGPNHLDTTMVPHTDVTRRVLANTNSFTNQTTWADFPDATDAAAMATTFTKQRSDTKLVLEVSFTCELTSGVAQWIEVGLSVASTDYSVAFHQFAAATTRRTGHGIASVSGVSSGSLAVKPRFKAETASSVSFWASDDIVSYRVTETF